jgi:hypothetical protein
MNDPQPEGHMARQTLSDAEGSWVSRARRWTRLSNMGPAAAEQ